MCHRGVSLTDALRTVAHKLKAFLRDPRNAVRPKWRPSAEVFVVPNASAVSDRKEPSVWDFSNKGTKPAVNYTAEEAEAHTLHYMKEFPDYRQLGNIAGTFFFPSAAWQRYYMSALKYHLHYRADLGAKASLVINRLLTEVGPYNAVHYRTSDYAKQQPHLYVSPEVLTARLAALFGNVSTTTALFVATDNPNRTLLQPLLERFSSVRFLGDYQDTLLPGLPHKYEGIIDTLICSAATTFVGSFGSTFSAYIHRLRGYMPYFVSDDVFYTNTIEYDRVGVPVKEDRETYALWWSQPGVPLYKAQQTGRESST